MSVTVNENNKNKPTETVAPVQNSVVPTTPTTGNGNNLTGGTPTAAPGSAPAGYGNYLDGLQNGSKSATYSSYGNYLAGITGNAKSPSVTAGVGSGYGAWLETQQRNYKAANTPTGAKSYGDYLAGIGTDIAGTYKKQVATSYGDYLAGLPTYGQSGEKMAKAGLVGSGYGDYLAGKAYEQLVTGKREAQRTANESLKATYASYGDYLAGITQQNEATAAAEAGNKDAAFGVLSQAVTTYGSLDAAVAALRGGQYDKYLDDAVARYQGVMTAQKGSGVATVSGTTDLAGGTVNAEMLANASSAVSTAMSGGDIGIDAAIASLTGIYDKATLDQVKSNFQGGNIAQYETNVKSATGVMNYKQMLDTGVNEGSYGFAIGDENYNKYLQLGYDQNGKYVDSALNGDLGGISAYAKAAGLDISGEGEDLTEKVDKVIDHMAGNGVITTEQRQSYYTQQTINSYNKNDYTNKDIVNEFQTLNDMVKEGKISEAQRQELMSALGGKTTNVELRREIDWGCTSVSGQKHATNIYYKQGKYGKESISLNWTPATNPPQGEFRDIYRDQSENNALVKDAVVAIGVLNGKLAVQLKNGKCYYASYSNTEHNAAFVAWALTHAK